MLHHYPSSTCSNLIVVIVSHAYMIYSIVAGFETPVYQVLLLSHKLKL